MFHLYGLIIGISIAVGIGYFSKNNHSIPRDLHNFFIIGSIICAIIGARAYHVVDQWSYYSHHLILIPQTWNGGLGIFGGIFGGLIFIIAFTHFHQISFTKTLDSISPILPLCQSIGRFGNFVNHENPIWWPEAILDLCLFIIIKKYPAQPTAKYFIGYGLIRLVTEFWRHDTWIIGTIKIGQIISVIFIILGILLISEKRNQVLQNHLRRHTLVP